MALSAIDFALLDSTDRAGTVVALITYRVSLLPLVLEFQSVSLISGCPFIIHAPPFRLV